MPRNHFQDLFGSKTRSDDDVANPSINENRDDVIAFNAVVEPIVNAVAEDVDRTISTSVVNNGNITASSEESPLENSKPGTESIAYLKRFISPAIQNIRDLKLKEKMNALADNLDEYPEKVRRELEKRDQVRKAKMDEGISDKMWKPTHEFSKKQSDEVMEEECQKLKIESEVACRQIGKGYDALVAFVNENPQGTYEEFIDYLLLNKADHFIRSGGTDSMNEHFYASDSHYRMLWNDNLTLGLDGPNYTTLDGRTFVAARDLCSKKDSEKRNNEEEGIKNSRPLSGEKLKQLSHIDRQKLTSSAFNVFSNVSSLAMKPLRDLQIAEKVNAMQLDIEEEEARREIQQYNLREEEKRDLEGMMRLKKEAEEKTLTLTKDHLMKFLGEHPHATYTQWIEDLVSWFRLFNSYMKQFFNFVSYEMKAP